MVSPTETSYGVDQYRTGEGHQSIIDRMTNQDGTRRGIVFCHGVGQTARGWAGIPTGDKILALAAAGYPVIGCDLSAPVYAGQNWGNNDHIAAIAAAVAYLRSAFGASASPVGLLGSSMGSQGALAYARQNLGDVFAVAGMIPVLDLTTIYVDPLWGPSYWTGIARAYAEGYDTVAAGSNGVNVTTFVGAQTLNVADTTLFPASGTLRVCLTAASPDTASTISYTAKTGTSFTGCTVLTGSGVLTTGDVVVASALPSLAIHAPIAFGASDLAGLPVRLWSASNDTIAATTAEATAWNGAGSTKIVTDLGAVGHSAGAVNAQQVVQYFDDNGGRT